MKRDARRGDAGMTLIELVLALGVLSVVLASTFSFLAQGSTVFKRTSERSRNNDEIMLAVNRLDRLIRSGNILYDPSSESDPGAGVYPGLSLRIYTQANSIQKCVQWRILDGVLQERSWSPQWETNGEVTDWWPVAEGLTNTTSDPAFSLHGEPGFGGRLMLLDLKVNTSSEDAAEVMHRAAIEGRNTQYGYDPSVCNSIPS